MNENQNTQVTVTENTSLVADLTSATVAYCSFTPKTPEERKTLFTAMNNPMKKLDECINMPINVKDVYAETVDFVDENTGVIAKGIRIVLIDTDGVSYGCCSTGIFNSLKKLFQVFGTPTWEEGLTIVPYTIPSRRVQNGKVLTIKLAD